VCAAEQSPPIALVTTIALAAHDRGGPVPGDRAPGAPTVRAALSEAERRGRVTRNAAKLARPPRLEELEVEPYVAQRVGGLIWGSPGAD
jgi:hypothetical protein